MRLTVTINCENEAFEDEQELGRLLRRIADKLDRGYGGGSIMDSNGNRVGEAKFEE